jgi:hypothetical protein
LTVSDEWHFIGYQIAALLFLAGGVWVFALVLRQRRRPGTSIILSTSLILGFLFYQATALIFISQAANLVTIDHAFALITHLLGVLWSFSTILLALSWLNPENVRKNLWWLLIASTLACLILISTFVQMYPGPPGYNYIVNIADKPLGKLYSSTYAISILAAKILVIVITVPQIRRVQNPMVRIGLILVSCGSLLIALFALMRLTFGVLPQSYLSPANLELLPLTAHVTGAIMYVMGIALVQLVVTAWMLITGIGNYWRLRPLCRAGVAEFPSLGAVPTLQIRDYWSVERTNTQVLAVVVLLLDVHVLLSRASHQPLPQPRTDSTLPMGDLRAAYRDDLKRMLAVASRYRNLRRAQCPSDALRRSLTSSATITPQ